MRLRTATAALSVLLCCAYGGAAETRWYATSEDLEATPFGYQKITVGESATYRGRSAVRNRLVQFASTEALGTKAEIETTSDYYLTKEGDFLGLYREKRFGPLTIVVEAWGEEGALNVTRTVMGKGEAVEKQVPLPKDVFFATSPSFLYPVMKAAKRACSFALFDFDQLGLLRISAYPEGTRKVTLPSGEYQAERYSMEIMSPAAGMITGRQMLYFDAKGRLVLSETLDEEKRTAGVMFLTGKDVEGRTEPHLERADVLPYQGMPLVALHPYLVLIKLNEDEAGRASFMLHEKSDVGSYRIEHWVRFVGPEEERAHTAHMYLDNDFTCLRFNVNGKVLDKDRAAVDVSYSRTMVHGGEDIRWTSWASNLSDREEGGRKEGRLETSDAVYVLDKHLFPGFALIASQVPLRIGSSHRIAVFDSGTNQAGFCQVRVVRKIGTKKGPLFHLELVGFVGRYIMLLDGDHLLRRLMMPMDVKGERTLVYDLVNPPDEGRQQE